MKKAVIKTGGKQYLVTEGQEIEVELIKQDTKKLSFVPLLVIDEKQIKVGNPAVEKSTVAAEILEEDKAQEKVSSIRYKSKKRVHTVRGHRQRLTTVKITKITAS